MEHASMNGDMDSSKSGIEGAVGESIDREGGKDGRVVEKES